MYPCMSAGYVASEVKATGEYKAQKTPNALSTAYTRPLKGHDTTAVLWTDIRHQNGDESVT